MLQAGVEDFLDPVQLGSPGGFHIFETVIHFAIHVVKAAIYFVETSVHIAETGIDVSAKIAKARVIDQNAD